MSILATLADRLATGIVEVLDLTAPLPATGALLIAAPLPIVSGSGAPARVLALVERG